MRWFALIWCYEAWVDTIAFVWIQAFSMLVDLVRVKSLWFYSIWFAVTWFGFIRWLSVKTSVYVCFHNLYRFLIFDARFIPNAGLAAPVVTVGALLIWSVVESESHIQKALLKLIRSPIFFLYELSHRRLLRPSQLLEPSGDVWSHREPSGVIWSYLEISGPIRSLWSLLEPSEAIWSHLEPSGAISSYLDISGGIWSLLEPRESSGTIWRHLEAPGAIWRHMVPSGVYCSHLKLSWPIWELSQGGCHHMLSFGLIRCYLICVELSWFELTWFEVFSLDSVWFDSITCYSFDSMRFEVVWVDHVRFDSIWVDAFWFDLIQIDAIRFHACRFDLVWFRQLVVSGNNTHTCLSLLFDEFYRIQGIVNLSRTELELSNFSCDIWSFLDVVSCWVWSREGERERERQR